MDTPLEECVRRDPKGLYSRAMEGQIKSFTGVDSPYEPPEKADVTLTTDGTAQRAAGRVIEYLRERGIVT